MQKIKEISFFPEKFTVRYLILRILVERPSYYDQIYNDLKKYGIKKDRVKIELCKLAKEKREHKKLVSRQKSKISGKYFYEITPFGVNYLLKKIESEKTRDDIDVKEVPLDPYRWLLESLLEPKTFKEICKIRNDNPNTISPYLSALYRMGIIEKTKVPERVLVKGVYKTVYETVYAVKPSVLKELVAKTALPFKMPFKIEINDIKRPDLTPSEEEEYWKWRQSLDDGTVRNIIRESERRRISPATLFRLVWKELNQKTRAME